MVLNASPHDLPVKTPGSRGTSRDRSVVAFGRHCEGEPVFLVPALYPSPWVFRPVVDAMQLARPIYGLRSPELDWRTDVLSLTELVAHYVTAIRGVQSRGPYTLVGYSFGGLVAFEIANRLAVDEEVRELILLDTAGPTTLMQRLRSRLRRGPLLRDGLAFLSRHDVIGAGALTRLGIRSPIARATLPITAGPLTVRELRAALRLLSPHLTWVDGMSLEELCATLIATIREMSSPAEWAAAERYLPLFAQDPVAAVKAYKVVVKNLSFARRHRIKTVFRGTVTMFASEGNRAVLRWQRYVSRPIRVRWVAADAGARPHLSFLDQSSVRLYARELGQVLAQSAA